jgi:hypothetical protein
MNGIWAHNVSLWHENEGNNYFVLHPLTITPPMRYLLDMYLTSKIVSTISIFIYYRKEKEEHQISYREKRTINSWSLCHLAVHREFKPRLCQTKDYKIGICCFFTKQH